MNRENLALLPSTLEEEDLHLQIAINLSLQGSNAEEQASGATSRQGEGCSSSLAHHKPNTSFTFSGGVNLDESSQMKLRRSMSTGNGSPRHSSQPTDCCEAKNALMVKDRNYIKYLVASWGRVTSPIHQAVRKGHNYCLEPLLKAFPDLINSTNSNGETPLYLAAVLSKPRALQQLLQFQADPNIGRSSLETPLLAAVDNDHGEMVVSLLKAGADVNKPLNRGWTVLHEAVYRGHIEILGMILRHAGNPNARDGFGISPVFTSAACGRNDCLKMLLHAGGDPNLCASSKTASPLYEACKEGHGQCVETLLANGANPHLVNCDGLFPIHIASVKGHTEIVESLLPVTDLNIAQSCGMSPIHSAAKGDHVDIIEMLINHGYDVNVKLTRDKITYRDRRQTALFFTVHNDSEEATELLLQAGADTELDYVKPLLVAVSHSQYDMTDLLLSYGADVNASFNEDGADFPAAVAFALKDYRMLKQVLVSGCDVEKCLNCEIGSRDHEEFSEEHQRRSFCHFITEEQHRNWCGSTVLYLLKFVGNTWLCKKIVDVVRHCDEWETIRHLIENPCSLQHLCRLKIRRSMKKFLIRDEKAYSSLPLPSLLQDFLIFSDV